MAEWLKLLAYALRARVAAILTDIIRREIVFAAANKARMTDDLRADRALSVPSPATGRILLCGGAGAVVGYSASAHCTDELLFRVGWFKGHRLALGARVKDATGATSIQSCPGGRALH